MVCWQSFNTAELLADVQLDASRATTLAWCPVNGLLAVGTRQHASKACVYLISPQCPEYNVKLSVSLQGPTDDLTCVAWSPVGCRRVLLTATKLGMVSAWLQQPPPPKKRNVEGDVLQISPRSMNDWWCQDIGQLGMSQPSASIPGQLAQQQASQGHVLAVNWLQPPARWPYTKVVLQEQDFQAGTLHNMFAPAGLQKPVGAPGPDPPAGADGGDDFLHWVQPGTLAFAAVLSSGTVVIGWGAWGLQGLLQWQLTPGITLLPPGPGDAAGPAASMLLTADVGVSADGVVVALTSQAEPNRVHIVGLKGNPLHHACLCAALQAEQPPLQVCSLATCTLTTDMPCAVRCLSWDSNSSGQRLLAASSECAAGSVSFSPHSSGPNSSLGRVTLLHLTAGQQQAAGAPGTTHPNTLAQTASTQVQHCPEARQVAWLLDGLLVGQQLLDAQSLIAMPVSLPLPPPPSPAAAAGLAPGFPVPPGSPGSSGWVLAASPHKVAVAVLVPAVVDSNSSELPSTGSSSSTAAGSTLKSRLLLYSIPPVTTAAAATGAAGPALAGRLLWALLLQLHSWDLVQHLLCTAREQPYAAQPAGLLSISCSRSSSARDDAAQAAACCTLQVQRVAQVLSLVDLKLRHQPAELQAMYAMRWDVLKHAVMLQTPGPDARVACINLRLRLLLPALELHLSSTARDEEVRQAQPQQQRRHNQVPVLVEYTAALLEYQIACLNTWLHRRVAAATAGAAAASCDEAVRAVPCMQFFLDINSSMKLASCHARATEMHKVPVSRACAFWKYISSSKPLPGQAEPQQPPANWEDLVAGAAPCVFALHRPVKSPAYPGCLMKFMMPPDQLLQLLQGLPDWSQVPILTDSDITAGATRLGLLPAKTPQARANFARQMQLHVHFRSVLPESKEQLQVAVHSPAVWDASSASKCSSDAYLQAAKRLRWSQQVRNAMGSLDGACAVGCDRLVDLVNMTWDNPSALDIQSVDGGVLAKGVVAAPDAGDAAAGESKSLRKHMLAATNNWVYACPIAGELWVRAGTACSI